MMAGVPFHAVLYSVSKARMPFSYCAYGLSIRSDLPLPELVSAAQGSDVGIRLGPVELPRSEQPVRGTCLRADAEEACLFWDGVGAFLVRGGREIVVDPAPGVEERVLRLFILGSALAVLLHQRGGLVLHASAVAAAGGAVAFLGDSGQGKSTMAAALHARGRAVVADDVVAVRTDAGSPIVFPGFPLLKLWPEAVAATSGDAPETLPQVHPHAEKRARRLTGGFQGAPLPLRRIYILSEGEALEIEPLRPSEAFMELVRYSYCAGLLPRAGAAGHFLQCGALMKEVAVRRLKRRRCLADLPEVARRVEEDLGQG